MRFVLARRSFPGLTPEDAIAASAHFNTCALAASALSVTYILKYAAILSTVWRR
jgi:hypothetical protein